MQEATLEGLPQEQQRLQELFYSYANATYRYHLAADVHEPSEQDYWEWLEGLPENVARGID